MSTSGNITLTYTRDDIIQEALEQVRAIEIGTTPEPRLIASAARTLNMMVKSWQTSGLQIHTVLRSYLFTTPDQKVYNLDATLRDRWVTGFSEVDVLTDAPAASTTIDLTSTAGVVAGSALGIYLDDGTMAWDTVNGPPVGNTVTLLSGNLGAVTASAGNRVFHYDPSTQQADRPMEIVEVWEHAATGNDRPLDLVSRNEYAELTLKSNPGSVVSVFYDPQVTDPRLFVWPVPSDPRIVIGTWVKRTINTFNIASDDADFPQEAFLALAFNLAMLLTGKMAVSPATAQFITSQAGIWYKNYQDYAGRPEEAVEFSPFDDVDWDYAGSSQP